MYTQKKSEQINLDRQDRNLGTEKDNTGGEVTVTRSSRIKKRYKKYNIITKARINKQESRNGKDQGREERKFSEMLSSF